MTWKAKQQKTQWNKNQANQTEEKKNTCWAATQDFQVGEMLGQTQN